MFEGNICKQTQLQIVLFKLIFIYAYARSLKKLEKKTFLKMYVLCTYQYMYAW